MLVLTRKTDEQILIGDNIKITLVRVRGNSVRIGIEAPRDVRVVRGELQKLAAALPAEESEGEELDDMAEVFAHPETIQIGGRARQATKHPASQSGSANRLPSPAASQVFVGTVRRASGDVELRRAPLAGFVSAT